jgi:hypothetical protein
MPVQVINGVGVAGIRNPNSSQSQSVSFDSDAQAFITSASLTETTQQNAVNDLVLDLKAAGIWTKMRTLYPMVGGTAASHKWNLKDPRDLDGAFRLEFNGGWTHSSSGATPNGTDGYAKTFISTSDIGLNTGHLSYYSRTNNLNTTAMVEIGGFKSIPDSYTGLHIRSAGSSVFRWNNGLTNPTVTLSDTLGFYLASRTASNVMKGYKNGSTIAGFSTTAASNATTTIKMYLGAGNSVGTSLTVTNAPMHYSNKQCAFASIGEGLTDIESTVFYQIIEKFQYALGRNVNTSKSFYYNRNYTNETNAFIFNGGITDTTQINAVDSLVTSLKTNNLWSKMIAIYPFVGGTQTSNTYNLANTTRFNLTFVGGWTFNSLGAKPNGTNGFARTNIVTPATYLAANNVHMSYYNVTNNTGVGGAPYYGKYEMAAGSTNNWMSLYVGSGANNVLGAGLGGTVGTSYTLGSGTDIRGFVTGSKTAYNSLKLYKNNLLLTANTTNVTTVTQGQGGIVIGANYFVDNGGEQLNNYSDRQSAFVSIGYGLTDSEVSTLYTIVQSYQTSLGRQV